jgi:hypothetical protein
MSNKLTILAADIVMQRAKEVLKFLVVAPEWGPAIKLQEAVDAYESTKDVPRNKIISIQG